MSPSSLVVLVLAASLAEAHWSGTPSSDDLTEYKVDSSSINVSVPAGSTVVLTTIPANSRVEAFVINVTATLTIPGAARVELRDTATGRFFFQLDWSTLMQIVNSTLSGDQIALISNAAANKVMGFHPLHGLFVKHDTAFQVTAPVASPYAVDAWAILWRQ